ncbi:MAG: c-type cytochrome [Halothiobacillaceae bacterium]|nr:MAG: c-type cytochrome [Halothiobacillaceae bacterium]
MKANNMENKIVLSVAALAAALMMSPVMAAEHAAMATKGPSTNVSWTAEQMRFVANGDKNRGGQLNSEMFCASCHGDAGVAPTGNWPSLAGQRAEYTFKMLKDYKDGKRHGSHSAEIMQKVTQGMSDQDMADLGQFYASFDLPALPTGVTFDAAQADMSKAVIKRGDGKRLVAPCQSCHGSNGEGAVTDTPALAGMPPEYFIKTMQEYKSGARANDVYSRMRLIAKTLTDDEISQMAHYYAGMTAK